MNAAKSETTIDCLVIGAGVTGLATALALLDDGREVTIIDQGLIGKGASHGNCGTLTPSHAPPLAGPSTLQRAARWMFTPDAPLYIKPTLNPDTLRWMLGFALRCNHRDYEASARAKYTLLDDSRQRIQQWVARYQLDCEFAETGEDYVFKTRRDMDRELGDVPLLRELGVDVEVVEGRDYEARDPAFKPGLAGALCFRGDAALRPDRYVAELARVVRERGGRILEQCALLSLESAAQGVVADTAQGRLRARDVVLATGAWAPRIANAVGLPWLRKTIQPGKGYSITYSSPELTPKRPVILYEPSVCVTAWPSGYRLGSTMEFSGYDDRLNAQRLGALERGAAQFLHHPVGPEVREQWCGWRPMSRDDIPLIGRAPGHAHLWLAVGHGMMGVSMSASTGQLLADMIAGRTPCVNPAPFDPARFG
ncbi:MAG TPA: FAD-dependent oxidoreductase [Thermomonas sp.]|nr:FAD-dependent oxidoreductase [Thermomonas sp.]HQY50337.1 FAD-dependent oxidoreductase [Thermomonas sp.]HRA57136.1 FAD-dependent oxidoreductase [Thermomonas sp.]